jgi:hypothetical protein
MLKIKKLFLRSRPAAIALSATVAVLFVVVAVEAATTISTNVVTGGTLSVTGASTLTGGATSGANVLSDTDSTDNLGITGTRWASTFSDNFTGNTITLDGATGVNILTVTDNVADALSIVDSSGDLLVFDTTTGSESFDVTPNATFAGTLTLTGDGVFDTDTLYVDVSVDGVGMGTTTPRDVAHVENPTATTTLIISTGAASKGGRIILEDHDGAGCSEVTVLNGTLATKTVTCPTGI